MIERATQRVTGNTLADRSQVMQVILLRLRDWIRRRQSEMRFKEQPAQDVTQPLVGKVSFIERVHHPVVKQIEFWIEEFVVGIERRAEQSSFRLESALDRCTGVRQHPAERRHCPTVADELLEKRDLLANAAIRRIRVDQHETEVKRQVEASQYAPGSQVCLRLEP